MWWYRVIIVSALSQRKRVKRERELDNLYKDVKLKRLNNLDERTLRRIKEGT